MSEPTSFSGCAMVATAAHAPLGLQAREYRPPRRGELLLRVTACGVCRTDLHLVDGELPTARYPVVPGHEVIGHVIAAGEAAEQFTLGQRVGVAWLAQTCGHCSACRRGDENLCEAALFHGCSRDGGFATHMLCDAAHAYPLPAGGSDAEWAPLLCAGLIGYRSLRACGDAQRLGIYGFGAAAHIVAQVGRWQHRDVHAFTRSGDAATQRFALDCGCCWAGDSGQLPPQPLDAAIIFAPSGELVPAALKAVRSGGRVICGGIHMSDIPSFPYALLWGERSLSSIANLTRRDGSEFLALAPRVPVLAQVRCYPLRSANEALDDLRHGRLQGAAVLTMPAD